MHKFRSIIRKAESEEDTRTSIVEERRDRYDKPVRFGSKTHKITFIDQVEAKPLCQVFNVESYKKYNKMGDQDAGCLLF